MDLTPFHPGRPGQDLGIAHTLKHWLHPAELWDDLAADVPESARPRQVRADLPQTLIPVWEAPTAPDSTIRGRWDQLEAVYRDGYCAVVLLIAKGLEDPKEAPQRWSLAGKSRLPTYVDDDRGVILRVRERQGQWELYTAFRPQIAQFTKLYCPPLDAGNVLARKMLYGQRALRLLSRWSQHEDSQ